MRDWLVWGLLWGFAGLVSPVLLGPLPFLAIWLAVRRSRSGLAWFWPGVLAACVLLAVLAPWTIRNYRAFGRLIPLRDGFWMEVHVGNNGDTSDVTPDSAHPTTSPMEYAQWRRLGEIGFMDAKKTEALSFIREHPGFFAWVTVRHVVNMWTGFWSLDPKFLADEPFHIPNVFFATAMTLLAVGGLRYCVAGRQGSGGLPPGVDPCDVPNGLLHHAFQHGLPPPARSHPRDGGLLLRAGVAETPPAARQLSNPPTHSLSCPRSLFACPTSNVCHHK